MKQCIWAESVVYIIVPMCLQQWVSEDYSVTFQGMLIKSLIQEIIVCISVNDMEVTGALQKRTLSIDGNTNRSRDPISHRFSRPRGFPQSELRIRALMLLHRPGVTLLTPADPKILHAHKSRKWFPKPLFGNLQCGKIPFPMKYFALIFKHLDAL